MTSGFEDHFSGVADGYVRFRPSYPEALFDHLAAASPTPAPRQRSGRSMVPARMR